MILVDAGPLVALFDPKDHLHRRCSSILKSLRAPLLTTIPVLTEAFHMLDQGARGPRLLRKFILEGAVTVWFMDQPAIKRALELMEKYADHPMDLADASLITAAERVGTAKIFTIDRRDFSSYRIRRGHTHEPVEIIE